MRPLSAEITPRRPNILGYELAALAFVAVGLRMLFASDSSPLVRLGGLVTGGFFGLAAGLFALDIVRPRSVLTLDRDGVHLRERRGGWDFDVPWSRLRAVSAPSDERPGPVLLHIAGPLLDREERSVHAESTTHVIPAMIGVPAADVAAEIERYRRAFAQNPPTVDFRGLP